MNDVIIRRATIEDAEGICAISNLSFHIPWSLDSIKKEFEENKFARYIVACKDNIVIGFVGTWVIFDESHITNIAVHPEYRKCGVASKILDALIELCKMENAVHLTLEVRKSNIPAQNLYSKFGFIEEGIRKKYYADNNEDAVIMWKHGF